MIDLDNFKRVNDTYGHSTGDAVLRQFANIMRETVRTIDIAARLGGEEFAILLPNTTQEEAMCLAERLRQRIADTEFYYEKGVVRITISTGAALLTADDREGDAALNRADTALYEAKDAGRNQSRWFL
jgi:diguanylate cyclase (GGDEF)-like protein